MATTLFFGPRKASAMKVQDLMWAHVITAESGSLASHAGIRMTVSKISGLPVVDSEKNLRGIVTEFDLIRALRAASLVPAGIGSGGPSRRCSRRRNDAPFPKKGSPSVSRRKIPGLAGMAVKSKREGSKGSKTGSSEAPD